MKKQGNNGPTTIVGTNFFVFFIRKSKPNKTIFLYFLIKIRKKNKAKDTKQNRNKVKRKVVKDSPCEAVLSLPAMALENSLMAAQITVELCWETPRGRYDEHNSKSSLR